MGQTSSEIVTQFATEFSLDELERGEKMDLQNLPLVRPSEMVNVEAGQINDKAADFEEDEEEDMEAENDENALPANIEVFAKQGKRLERKIWRQKMMRMHCLQILRCLPSRERDRRGRWKRRRRIRCSSSRAT